MKKLKYLIFLFIVFLAPSVFADTTYDMTSRITSPVNFVQCGNGSYTGVELNGTTDCWNTNTRYQGTLSRIYFNLPAPTGTIFEPDTSYLLSIYMASDDWRNRFGTVAVRPGSSYTNNFVDTFTFVSMKQVNITFTVPYSGSTTYQTLWVDLPATNIYTLITGETNWNLNKVNLTKLTTGSAGGSTSPSGPSSSFDDTSIINNANENTQDVINNANQNTQDVINNANQNSQNIIDNQNENTKSTNNLLGYCYENLYNYFKAYYLNNLNYVNGSYVQSQPDTSDRPGLKLQYYLGSSYVNTNSFLPYVSVGRFIWTFTKDNTFDRISFGVNGSSIDSTVMYDVSYLKNGQTYSLIYNVTNATQGSITLSDIMLVEGNQFLPFVEQGKQKCTSRLDTLNDSVNNAQQSIIDNQNSNTQQQIESQKVCSSPPLVKTYNDRYLYQDANLPNKMVISSRSGLKLFVYDVSNFSSVSFKFINYNRLRVGVYDTLTNVSDTKIDLVSNINDPISGNTYSFSTNGKKYLYMFLSSDSNTLGEVIFDKTYCVNGNQSLNDSLTNSNVDSDTGTGFFDNFDDNDYGLSQIITIPLNTIQSLTSKTCVPLTVPIPFTNSNITLPCMTQVYENNLPTIYNLWKIVSFGIIAYLIAIDIFHIVKGFKDPESDKVEVLDL